MDIHHTSPPAGTRCGHNPRQALGGAGEDLALAFLRGKGFRLRERNWRPRGAAARLELDLVGDLKSVLLFVEVKSRRATGALLGDSAERSYLPDKSSPLGAFTPAKRAHLVRAARHFLAEKALWDKLCRFDLVCVSFFPDGSHSLEHHEHVIELDKPVGGGNAAWQPW